MNKARREEIEKAAALIAEALEILSAARDEEQEYLDAMPESLQFGEKGERAQEAIDALETVCDALDSISGDLETAAQ